MKKVIRIIERSFLPSVKRLCIFSFLLGILLPGFVQAKLSLSSGDVATILESGSTGDKFQQHSIDAKTEKGFVVLIAADSTFQHAKAGSFQRGSSSVEMVAVTKNNLTKAKIAEDSGHPIPKNLTVSKSFVESGVDGRVKLSTEGSSGKVFNAFILILLAMISSVFLCLWSMFKMTMKSPDEGCG